MFTGIVSAIGKILELEPRQGDLRLTFFSGGLGIEDVHLGDSISCNGVCLTAVE